MASLKRLLKPRFLEGYLQAAYRSHEQPMALAVWTEGRLLAGTGDGGAGGPRPDDRDALALPLRADGGVAGQLVVRAAPPPVPGAPTVPVAPDVIRQRAEFLAASLQAIIDAQEGKRAVGAEALDLYRELSQLHRAAIGLNRSLRQVDVADALLDEAARGGTPADLGAVFRHDPHTRDFPPLAVLRSRADADLARLTAGRLFRGIFEAGRGEIVNDLAGEPRWAGEVPGLASILVVPLVGHGRCAGALVLGATGGGREFTAGDLKRASTLASMAAAALRNAQLFEEVVEVKNYSETILENLSNGVVTLDRTQRVTRANAAALRMLGRNGADVAGRPVSEVFEDGNAWVLDGLAAVARDGEDHRILLDRELRRADGGAVSINLTVLPLTSVANETIGSMLVFEDVTREKRIRGTMVRFMSDRVVDQLLDSSESILGGNAQEVTILFSDIRRFTTLSEGLLPRDLVETLNEYFTEMVDVIFERGGTLDKFIGDALMAVFGAPFVTADDTDHAVEAAVGMVRRLRACNRRWVQQGRPPLDIGVGINTGEVVAGTIGSPRRMDYTVIGDHVNLAARIEAANRYYGTQVLVSEHTIERLDGIRRWRELDRIRVKGRGRPIRLFEILDHHTEDSFPGMDRALAAFERGLARYRRREWEAGAANFAEALRANPKDRPTQIFLDRCWTHIAQPPDDAWTDVTDLGALAK